MRVVATAGHVDHGKSTLVWALTGVDPDRWVIEKQRGMTIDLGFAATTLPSGAEIGFIDVPGHGRFVKNMLAGVGSVDACLFVVAATEGWKEQSEEHFRILELLGVTHGVVALTKVAVAGPELTELASLEIQDRVAGTFLEGAPVLPVDVPAGLGLGDLRQALDRLVAETPAAPDRGRPRMWVDRSFSVKGSGTVITGTLTGGCVATGDEMRIEWGNHPVRIRTLESHGRSISRAAPGRRLAANLVGVPHRGVGRGQALVRSEQWHLSRCFDASLDVLHSLDHAVTRRGAYAVYVGSGEFPVRLRVLGPRPIEPGEGGFVRLWLRTPTGIPLSPGDRYVLREAGRFETVGGGEILDVEPVVAAARAHPSRSVERVLHERGWVDVDELFRLTGERLEPTAGRWAVDPDALKATAQAVLERCEKAAEEGVDLAQLGDQQRALLARGIDGIEVKGGRVFRSGMAREELSGDARRVLSLLEAGRWSPPSLPLSDRAALRELERAGLAVEARETWFAASAVESAVDTLAALLAEKPDGFTVADARDRLASSRKHVLPLLAYLDSIGVTSRRGDLRVAGRKMPAGRPGSAR
jgi:selenocysteine-specific elongation factor